MSKKYKYGAIALTALIVGAFSAGCSSTTVEEQPVVEAEPTVTARVEHDIYLSIGDQLTEAGIRDDVMFTESYYWEMAEAVCEARDEGVSHEDTMHLLNGMMAMKRPEQILQGFTDVLYANECPEHRL